jgi:signal peptidase II
MIRIGEWRGKVKHEGESRLERPLEGLKKALWMYMPAIDIIALDQISKHLIRSHLPLGQTYRVTDFFNLFHVINKGGAFSVFYGNVGFLAAVSLAVVAFLIVYERRKPSLPIGQAVCLGILLGGTVGNLVDRLVFGEVTDFLDVYVGTYHWPTFNVADIAINLGVVSLLILQVLQPTTPVVPSREEHHR